MQKVSIFLTPVKKVPVWPMKVGGGGGVVREGGQNMHLNQSCRNFHEMQKSTNFFPQVEFKGGGGGGGGEQGVWQAIPPTNTPKFDHKIF